MVISVHMAVMTLVFLGTTPRVPTSVSPLMQATIMVTQPPKSLDGSDTVPLPDMQAVRAVPDLDVLEAIQFEDPEDDAQILAPASSPRLLHVQSVSISTFARKAGVLPHKPVTVVLAILVKDDGSTDDVRVTQSSGNVAIDTCAMEYVRALRWIPATVGHRPQRMRIVFPIVLSVDEA